MDPLDDFEFRPLTEGLGFHKKTIKLQEQMQRSGVVENRLGATFPEAPPESPSASARGSNVQTLEELLKSLEKPAALQMTEPLPRMEANESMSQRALDMDLPIPNTPAMPSKRERRSTLQVPDPGSEASVRPQGGVNLIPGTKRSASNSPSGRLIAATVSAQAAILDAVVVTAVTLLFLVSLVLVTKIEVLSVILSAQTDMTTQMSLGLLFLAVLQMYVVVARSFFGRTLGEWTFDYQLGTDEDHKKAMYPFKVAWRSMVVILTGVIVLPILSWITGQDLAGRLSGVRLYQQRLTPLG